MYVYDHVLAKLKKYALLAIFFSTILFWINCQLKHHYYCKMATLYTSSHLVITILQNRILSVKPSKQKWKENFL